MKHISLYMEPRAFSGRYPILPCTLAHESRGQPLITTSNEQVSQFKRKHHIHCFMLHLLILPGLNYVVPTIWTIHQYLHRHLTGSPLLLDQRRSHVGQKELVLNSAVKRGWRRNAWKKVMLWGIYKVLFMSVDVLYYDIYVLCIVLQCHVREIW